MGFHTFDPAQTDRLEDPSRFRFCSREELLQYLPRGKTLLDVGSGTGFYTTELAPFFEQVYALDLQPEMHRQYRERGVPENVSLLTADGGSIPLKSDSVDATVSTMTYHEAASEKSLTALYRVMSPDGIVVVVDWSRAGNGDSGPPRDERYDAATAAQAFTDAGFTVEHATERSETFQLVAHV